MSPMPCGAARSNGSTYGTRKSAISLPGRKRCSPVVTACAGSCGPGSLHFINGLFESHRNRAPVVLIASQVTNDEVGFDFPQEVDFKPIYQHCSVFCEEIRSPAHIDATHLGRRHPITFGAVGDVKATVEALLPRITPRTDRRFLDECLDRYARAVARANRRAKVGRSGAIHPQYPAALISKYAAEDAIFAADAGSPTVWLLRHVQANGRRRTIISLTHGTMANAMPQALGAKKALPQRQVISLSAGQPRPSQSCPRPGEHHPVFDRA